MAPILAVKKPSLPTVPRQLKELRARARALFPRRRQLTPFVPGNHVSVLFDGGEYFDAFIAAIESAKSYVFVEVYILASDQTGARVAEALAKKAEAGVEVALIYDSFGSMGVLDSSFVEALAARGVKVEEYAPVSWLNLLEAFRRRNHRKSVIVDGRIGIVGGLNVSDDYAAVADGGKGWRDTGVRVEGPAVAQLEAFFREGWRNARARPLVSLPGSCPPFADGYAVRFDTNEGRRDRASVRRAYLEGIVRARSTVLLTHAYFTPDAAIIRALRRVARRGVRVELITARTTDVKASWHVARGLYASLLPAGVRIHEWHERVLHAKTAVIDGEWVAIGSANLNRRSLRFDLEVNAFAAGPAIGKIMDERFAIDRARSEEITLEKYRERPVWDRFLEWLFGLFRPLF
ncbi:MAG: phosphatidylserine/phosphatidylglycerophosphate/cardiolipin synthase family protein [Deltaproteobacteria bacterium]|nr:phosphatidylserine/phosphatidylglycerophosphate/cardiolipin synthase family protein [Deltaproteobacteria bacterium]